MIQGAIFDMDGVLVDNLEYHIRAWQQLGREHGRSLSRESVRRVFGQRNDEMIRSLFGSPLSRDVLLLYATRKEEIYRALMAPELAPVPGLARLLARSPMRSGAVSLQLQRLKVWARPGTSNAIPWANHSI